MVDSEERLTLSFKDPALSSKDQSDAEKDEQKVEGESTSTTRISTSTSTQHISLGKGGSQQHASRRDRK